MSIIRRAREQLPRFWPPGGGGETYSVFVVLSHFLTPKIGFLERYVSGQEIGERPYFDKAWVQKLYRSHLSIGAMPLLEETSTSLNWTFSPEYLIKPVHQRTQIPISDLHPCTTQNPL